MRLTVVGCDISKDWFDIHVLDSEKQSRFANNTKGFRELLKFFKKGKVTCVRICMEATGMYYEELAEFMHNKGHEVVVENAQSIKAYGRSELRRAKTDPQDAKLIAQYCSDKYDRLDLWVPPSPDHKRLKLLLRRRSQLVDIRTAEKNRLKAGYRDPSVMKSIKMTIAHCDREIAEIEAEAKALVKSDRELARTVEIAEAAPGIGWITAATVVAEVPSVCWTPKAAGAFSGLAPRLDSSGKRRGAGAICRIGSARVRGALYWPSIVAARSDTEFGRFYKRLLARGLAKKQALAAVARKLLVVVCATLRTNRKYDPNYVPAISAAA